MPQPRIENPYPLSGVAAQDMATYIDRFVFFDENGEVDICTASDDPDGVMQNNPDIDQGATVNILGKVRLVLGATTVKGDELVPNATGAGVPVRTTASGGRGFAVALEGGVSGETITVKLGRPPRPDGGIETVSANGALSLYTRTSLLSIDGTKAYTLASGRYIGQRKTIRCISATNTPAGTVAGAFTTDGTATTSAAYNAAADQLELEWNGTAWQVLGNVSVTLS